MLLRPKTSESQAGALANLISHSLLRRSLSKNLPPAQREEVARAAQFILHASLDMVDVASWTTSACYLKVVDRHSEQLVSAYATQGGLRMLVLHDARNEEGIRLFCGEVHELYCKLCLNPFYVPGSKIESRDFDAWVWALGWGHLGLGGG